MRPRFGLVPAIAALSLVACDYVFHLESVTPPALDASGSNDGDVGGSGLIAHYTMDSLANGTLIESIAGRDGRCNDCPVPGPSHIDGTMTFNGASDVVSVDPTSAFSTVNGLTVSLWIRLETGPTGSLCVVSKRLGTDTLASWQICADPGPVLKAYWDQGGEKDLSVGMIVEDQWHHVAMRWDGNSLGLVLDGATVASTAAQVTFDNASLIIGGDVDASAASYLWDGSIDELRIYDRALTMPEIQALSTP